MSIQFATVGLYDNANSIQTKTVMAMADFPKRFAAPIVGRRVELGFRLLERKEELVVIYFGRRNERALAAKKTEETAAA